jgi:hypothetical protein
VPLDVEKEATTSTPQSTTTKFNQPELVAAGQIFSQGTDQPTTEQENQEKGAYETPKKEGNSSEP